MRPDRQRKLADGRFLAAQVRLAQQAIEAPQFEVAQDLLDAIAPEPRAGDIGEFAWHYLRRLARARTRPASRAPAWLGCMALAGDGQTAAVGYNDNMLVAVGPGFRDPLADDRTVKCRKLVISEDGRILAAEQANTSDGSFAQITAWDTKTGRVLGQFAMDVASKGPSFVGASPGRWPRAPSGISTPTANSPMRIHGIGAFPVRRLKAWSKFSGLDSSSILPGADFFVTCKDRRLRVRDAFTGAVRRELPRGLRRRHQISRSRAMADAWRQTWVKIRSS